MNQQKIQDIDIRALVLWTENPRDPIDENANDQDIVDRALDDKLEKWSLRALAQQMGEYYDFSELPTIVYRSGKPVVYDGNRRVVLGKLFLKLVAVPDGLNFNIPPFPDKIPCNVCPEDVALKNIYRKHSGDGSWRPLERDIFRYRYMHEPKSTFILFNELTGIIDAFPHLNKRFVKEEVFTEARLAEMGFFLDGGKLRTNHSKSDALAILTDISDKVLTKEISTRNNRWEPLKALEKTTQKILDTNKERPTRQSDIHFDSNKDREEQKQRVTRRIKERSPEIFGETIYLRPSDTNNLYRDICELYRFYQGSGSGRLSGAFPAIIRMSLRLLCELAAKEEGIGFDNYVKENFDSAKKLLSSDAKTTLSNNGVTKDKAIQLLHTGAHTYSSAKNMDQTIALSIAIGAILKTTHGKPTN